jgi:hypothetical protein
MLVLLLLLLLLLLFLHRLAMIGAVFGEYQVAAASSMYV